MKRVYFTGILLFCVSACFGYADTGSGVVSIGNRLDYSISGETSEEILEDYFDIDYTNGPFVAKLRYEVFQPSEETRDRQGLVFRAVGGSSHGIQLWIGHFYTLFGRGLAFRGYEDRELRVDTSLDGVHFSYDNTFGMIKGLSGRTPDETHVFHGIDGEVYPITALTLGGSYISRRRTSTTGYNAPGVELGCGRAQLMLGPIDFYGEYGERSGDGSEPTGRGAYVAATGYVLNVGFSFEYKDYEHMSLKSEVKEYTNPPAALSEHSWALFAKHAHELNMDDERGFLAQVDYRPGDQVGITGVYSTAEDHDGVDRYTEATGELHLWEFSSNPASIIGGYTEEYLGMTSLGSDPMEDTREYITVMAEGTVPISDMWSLKAIAGHQHAKGDAIGEYDLEHVELEVTKSPGLSLAIVGEWSNASDYQSDLPWLQVFSERKAWFYGQVFMDILEGHQLRLMIGSRPEGKVCAGGACRIEPEFEGIEVSILSIF